jgi:hypothetical protein
MVWICSIFVQFLLQSGSMTCKDHFDVKMTLIGLDLMKLWLIEREDWFLVLVVLVVLVRGDYVSC